MSTLKTIQLVYTKIKPSWSRFLILPVKDRFRSYSTYKGQKKPPSRATSIFLACALISGSAITYTIFKSKKNKFLFTKDILDSFIPNVNAEIINPQNVSENRHKYNFIADAVELCAPSVVYIEVRDSKKIDLFSGRPTTFNNGSGFIVEKDGLILTSAHVVMKKPNSVVRVRLLDGTSYNGVVEDVDFEGDLALIRIDKKNLPVMKLGSSENLRAGEFVVAIGSPLSLSNTITSGVVSSANRPSKELGILHTRINYIQTDAAITFGNSGGPLVNLDGEAIGVNAMKITPGISFAIPIDYAKNFLKEAEKKRKGNMTPMGQYKYDDATKGMYLGITMLTLTADILSSLQHYAGNFPLDIKHGVLIWKVIKGSPAHIGGLLPGDIITHANGEAIKSAENIYKILEKPGSINLKIVRNGLDINLKVEPEKLI